MEIIYYMDAPNYQAQILVSHFILLAIHNPFTTLEMIFMLFGQCYMLKLQFSLKKIPRKLF
ncbi:hypothetical protein BLOT_014195 [Blomia tropicalis]|nr:hypothetical protein BLOT_014195 [Blomia tropicalis]